MHEANYGSNNDFHSFQEAGRDTSKMYLKARLAEELDRKRLLDLLHQGIIPKLISLHLKMESTKYSDSVTPEIQQMKALIDSAIENVHTLTDEIAPHVLFRVGLRAALHELFSKYADNDKIRYYINLEAAELCLLDDSINLLIYNLVKKLVNGAVRACSADMIGISLQKRAISVDITIQDNGSFTGNIQEIVTIGHTEEQSFLVEAGEQVISMGGKFWIDKAVGMRTVFASIPLKQPDFK